jgi:flagellar biosynthesis protein FlhF
MIIRKYIANDMKEAIIRAKYELGPETVIVSQRPIRIRKWYNPIGKKMMEVTFAIEERPIEKETRTPDINIPEVFAMDEKEKEEILVDVKSDTLYQFAGEQTKKRLDSYLRLHNKEGQKLSTKERRDFFNIVMKGSSFDIKTDPSRIVILVGPTGVGKTTTIAKLAANQLLGYGKKVGLVTMDTYRIGAVEQLKTYAGILGVPFHVVNNPEDMEQKLELLKDCEMVLVDTLGTSPRDMQKLVEIKKNLNAVSEPSTTYLVVSMSTDRDILDSILERYRMLKYDALVITKADEAENTKNLWHLIETNRVPVHYFCHGQAVPDDIKEATSDNIFNYFEENFRNDRSGWKIKNNG